MQPLIEIAFRHMVDASNVGNGHPRTDGTHIAGQGESMFFLKALDSLDGLHCREDTEIAPRTIELIPGNVIVRIPEGYMLLLTLRSSTPRRKGLLIPNGVGIIDQDYCGEGDELMVQVFNFREEAVTVKRGERIAQGIFVPVLRVSWNEVDEMGKGRGGFGSTGA